MGTANVGMDPLQEWTHSALEWTHSSINVGMDPLQHLDSIQKLQYVYHCLECRMKSNEWNVG